MPVIHINDEEFETFITENELVLVDFYADWCGPCKMIAPILEELGEEGHIIAKINVDENSEKAREFGVISIPTLMVFKNGEVAAQHVGFAAKAQLENLIK